MKFKDYILYEKEYHMSHRPENTKINASDLSKDSTYHPSMPADFYDNPEPYMIDLTDDSYKQSADILMKLKGDRSAMVTIYRASLKDEFNDGDWVTLSKKFAEKFSENEPELKVFTRSVPVKHVIWSGESINEFGYYPKGKQK